VKIKIGASKDEKTVILEVVVPVTQVHQKKVTFKTNESDRDMQRELKAFIFFLSRFDQSESNKFETKV